MPNSASLSALLVYAAWTMALVSAIAALRVYLSMTGQRRPNAFSPAGDDVSPFSGRLCRAHANCYENLPIFAALVLVAQLSGNAAITDGLAWVVVGARMLQSCVHLASTRSKAVMLRFFFMLVQLLIQAYWVLGLTRALLLG
ncbi:MAG: MAPEG family protein [Rhodoferax sp.]